MEGTIPQTEGVDVRFCPIRLIYNEAYDPAVILPRWRNHLFALALEAYRNGARVDTLPTELEAEQAEAVRPLVKRNVVLEDMLDNLHWNRLRPDGFQMRDMLVVLGELEPSAKYFPSQYVRVSEDVKKYLLRCGFAEPKRSGGKWLWKYPPEIREIRAEQCVAYSNEVYIGEGLNFYRQSGELVHGYSLSQGWCVGKNPVFTH